MYYCVIFVYLTHLKKIIQDKNKFYILKYFFLQYAILRATKFVLSGISIFFKSFLKKCMPVVQKFGKQDF